jgi:hypothetical protein
VVMRCISDASEPIPSPNVATFFEAFAMFLVVLLRGIGTPRIRLRRPRAVSTAPPASPASPAPVAISGTFAFLTTSTTVLPADTAPSFAVSAASAIGPWALVGVERLRAAEFCFRAVVREPAVFERELPLRERDVEAEAPLRLEADRFFEPLLEFFDERLVC